MKKKLEDIVNARREEFDDQQPPAPVWDRIDQATTVRKLSAWNKVSLWRAAAVVFFALSAYQFVAQHPGVPQGDGNQAVLNEFRDVEAYYAREISQKVNLIDEYNRSERLNGFTRDFQQLEAMYQVLREEMKARPSEKVKDALVLNLLVRIDLLNQQLDKLERQQSDDDRGGEEDERASEA